MKKLTYLVMAACCMVINACRKSVNTQLTQPESVDFELTDKNGQSLIHSLKDSVKVSYMQNGVLKYHNLIVQKLRVSASDTTSVKYYNGLVINDGTAMSSLSGSGTDNVGAINNFVIYLNGISMGNIYLDYWGALGGSANAITFNNKSCLSDRSFPYFSPGSDIILLQMQ